VFKNYRIVVTHLRRLKDLKDFILKQWLVHDTSIHLGDWSGCPCH